MRPLHSRPPIAVLFGALLALSASLAGCALPALHLPASTGGPFADLSNHLTTLAADPAHPNRLYLGARQGLFISSDSGAHWPASAHGPFAATGVRALAPSALANGPLWLVAGDGSVWLSPDAGDSWRPAATYAPPAVQPAAQPTAHPTAHPTPTSAPTAAAASTSALPARAVAWIEPGQDSTGQAFAAVSSFGLYTTTDAGATWSPLPLPAAYGVPQMLLPGPANSHRLLVATKKGLYRSTDGGAHWAPAAFIQGAVLTLAASPTKPDIVYCATDHALYRSTNGGASFVGLTGGDQFTFLVVGATPDTLYAVDGLRILRSTDGGRTWTAATPSPGTIAALAVAPATTGDAHADAVFVALAAPPGLLTSLDGGATWGQTGG